MKTKMQHIADVRARLLKIIEESRGTDDKNLRISVVTELLAGLREHPECQDLEFLCLLAPIGSWESLKRFVDGFAA